MSGSQTSAPPPPGECPTDLQSFAVQLRRMTGEFNRIVQEFAQAHGLHHTDMLALIAILDGGGPDAPMTPGRLRRQLNLTSGAMTACLDRLERAGHIRRVRASDDRRVVHLEYEDRAKGLAREYFRPLARGTDTARGRFTAEELRVVIRFLTELNHELALLRGRTE